MFRVLMFGVVAACCLTQTTAGDLFEYVVGSAAAPKPVFRSIESGLPAGIDRSKLLANFDPDQSGKWSLGWLTYGQNNSRSVAVGLRGNSDLFVDINRDRQFSADELAEPLTGDKPVWRVAIGAEFITRVNEYDHFDSSLLLRSGRKPGTLEVATEGVMIGRAEVGEATMAAMRIDRDASGRWFDERDRILLDTNQNGQLDRIGERLSCDSVCLIGGKRYVVQSDQAGESLEFDELSGLGTLILRLDLQSPSASVREIAATVVSRGGIRVPIRQQDSKVECPVGKYRIEELTMEIAEGENRFWFRFSSDASADHPIEIVKGESVEVSMPGEVELINHTSISENPDSRLITVHPRLIGGDGLYLTGCRKGRSSASLENRLIVEASVNGKTIDINSTGFS